MPEMDGFEATRAIRLAEEHAGRGHLPIVALTANAVKGDREQCLAAGMDDYVSKPISIAALREVMDRLLSKSRSQGKTPAETALPVPVPAALPHSTPIDVLSILERCMHDARVVERILQTFRHQVPLTMGNLRRQIDAGVTTEVARLAHSVKGASANISADALRDAACQLEQLAKSATLDGASSYFDAIEKELARCMDYMPKALVHARAMTFGTGHELHVHEP